MIIFNKEIMIEPVAKQRPRVFKRGGKSFGVTPQKTRNFERDFKNEVLKFYKSAPRKEAIHLSVVFNFKKKKTSKLLAPHIDLDNAIKAALDALNGVIYVDDKQVTSLVAKKRFYNNSSIELLIEIA